MLHTIMTHGNKKRFTNTHINNKLASLGATLVRNSAHPLTYSLTGVKCRATSVAKNSPVPNNAHEKRKSFSDDSSAGVAGGVKICEVEYCEVRIS